MGRVTVDLLYQYNFEFMSKFSPLLVSFYLHNKRTEIYCVVCPLKYTYSLILIVYY